jgi:hypothetical protein
LLLSHEILGEVVEFDQITVYLHEAQFLYLALDLRLLADIGHRRSGSACTESFTSRILFIFGSGEVVLELMKVIDNVKRNSL